MDILLCGASMDFGGAETHMLTLALALTRSGHRVTVAASYGKLCEKLREGKVRFIHLPLSGKNVGGVRRSYKDLRKILRSMHFDVVHAHSRLSALIVYLIRKSEGLDFRFIVTAHANYKTTRALRLCSVWGDHCIAVSRDIKNHLVKNYGVSSSRITVIPNGIDTDKYHPVHDRDPFSVLFVSRLDKDCSKGARALCRIAPKLIKEFPTLHITLCGGGDDLPYVSELAENVNQYLGKRIITITGKCSDVAGLMAENRCVVGVSRVALEAMSMGKSVILYGNEGALGLLSEKNMKAASKTNFTCRGYGKKFSDADFMNELRKAFTMSKSERKRSGEYFRKKVLAEYSAEIMAEKTLSVYKGKCRPSADIMIGGYYGFGNIGDDSVLASITEVLKRELPESRLRVLSRGGKNIRGVRGAEFCNRFSPIDVLKGLSKSDVYISGGGSLFQNKTSLRSLAYYCFILAVARKMGKKTVILSNGIGPVNGRLAEKMVVNSLLNADYVSVRDVDSFLKVSALTEGEVCPVLSADPVFLLYRNLLTSKCKSKSIMDYGGRLAAVALNGKDRVTSMKTAEAIGMYCKEKGLIPVFIPMDKCTDMKTARMAAAKFGGIVMTDPKAECIASVLSRSELAIGSRLHFLIFSICLEVQIVPLFVDPKIDSFSYELYASPAVEVTERDDPTNIKIKIEKFIKENHNCPSDETKEALEAMCKRASNDIISVIKLCTESDDIISDEKITKSVEKKPNICYNNP